MTDAILADIAAGPDGTCGHPSRMITTNGLSGHTTVECTDCERETRVRDRRAAFERAAFEYVARFAGLTVDELRLRLGVENKPSLTLMPMRPQREARFPTICRGSCGIMRAGAGTSACYPRTSPNPFSHVVDYLLPNTIRFVP